MAITEPPMNALTVYFGVLSEMGLPNICVLSLLPLFYLS